MSENKLNSALVIGGGVAGITAALDIASQGFKVYLVERNPSIGGVMAQIDKTFPTLDCSACILTPKLSEVSRHKNIEILTYSEVGSVTGSVGDFHVRVKRKARYVNEDVCTGCGDCAEECPVEVANEFDLNIGFRKAIYVPFPQATPNVYTVDKENCIDCGRCVKACQRNAIDLDMKDTTLEFHVGAIIIATGGEEYKGSEYGYGSYARIVTQLEFEQYLADSQSIGIPNFVTMIQCVGPAEQYCSRICCSKAVKNALELRKKKSRANIYFAYRDIRTYGFAEEYYSELRDRGALFFRYTLENKPQVEKIRPDDPDSRIRVTVFDPVLEKDVVIDADLLVLDGMPLEANSHIEYVFCGGRLVVTPQN